MNLVSAPASFHRDALGQIAWLVDIAAAPHRDVIREQLQRDDLEESAESSSWSDGIVDHVIGTSSRRLRHPRVTIAMTMSAARLHFLNIRKRLLVAKRLSSLSGSRVASTTTGRFSSISAFGPCFISPAG